MRPTMRGVEQAAPSEPGTFSMSHATAASFDWSRFPGRTRAWWRRSGWRSSARNWDNAQQRHLVLIPAFLFSCLRSEQSLSSWAPKARRTCFFFCSTSARAC